LGITRHQARLTNTGQRGLTSDAAPLDVIHLSIAIVIDAITDLGAWEALALAG
jgi:hypothetical protein